LDDFRPRLSKSAFDPAHPYDPAAEPTHWIFVELESFNRVVEASCGNPQLAAAAETKAFRKQPERDIPAKEEPDREDRYVRLPEIERRTGMSRATIYRRISSGRFPKQVPMDGNVAVWLESEFAAWLANPR
jgi:predicted DNA-binding transcriptional regulator AlpA